MQEITKDNYAMQFNTPEKRKAFIKKAAAGTRYIGENDKGEEISVHIYNTRMIIVTYQTDGAVRHTHYDSEGRILHDFLDGRWKDHSYKQEETESSEVVPWNKLMAAIKDAKRVEYEVDAAKSVLYFMSDHFGLILSNPKDFLVPMRLAKPAKDIEKMLKEHLGKAKDIATKTRLTYHALHDKGVQKILIGTNAEGKKYPVFIPAKLWDVVDGHETSVFTNGSIGTVVVVSEAFFAFIRPTQIHDAELSGLKETLREFGGNCV
jgi:hypothetical protein